MSRPAASWVPRAVRVHATLRALARGPDRGPDSGPHLRGGAIIGEGMQGVAFMPPPPCAPGYAGVAALAGRVSPLTRRPATYVGKVTSKAVAAVETDISTRFIKTVDPYARFTAPVVAECPLSAVEAAADPAYAKRAAYLRDKGWDTIVFSQYRGNTIENIFEAVETRMLSVVALLEVMNALANLLVDVAINVNGKAGTLHGDAHAGNVVYDSDTKAAALIDFGFAQPLEAGILAHMSVAVPASERPREAARRAAALTTGHYADAPATVDVTMIHNDLIIALVMQSRGTSDLKSDAPLERWLTRARELRRREDASQQAYMDSASALTHHVRRIHTELAAKERAGLSSLAARITSDLDEDDD